MRFVICLFICFLISCKTVNDINTKERNWYEKATQEIKIKRNAETIKLDHKESYSFKEITAKEFIRTLRRDYKQNVVLNKSLDDMKITIDIDDLTFSEVLTVFTKRYSLNQIQLRNNYVYITNKQQDVVRDYIIDEVKTLNSNIVEKIIRDSLTEDGEVTVTDFGMVIVSDESENLIIVQKLINELKKSKENLYALQLHFIALSNSDERQLDLDIQSNVNIVLSTNLNFDYSDDLLTGILRFAKSSTTSKVLASPFSLIQAGKVIKIKQTDTLLIEKIAKNENDTFEKDYEEKETGFISEMKIDELEDKVLLSLNIRLSSVIAYQYNLPVIRTFEANPVGILQYNIPRMICAFDFKELIKNKPLLGSTDNYRSYSVKVFARVVKIQ